MKKASEILSNCFCFLFFLIGLPAINAQSLAADQELKIGDKYGDYSMVDSSLYHLYKADSLYQEAGLWTQQMKCKAIITKVLFNAGPHSAALDYLKKAISYGKEKEGNHDGSLGVMQIYKGFIEFTQGQPIDSALTQLETGLELLESGEALEEEAWIYYYFKALTFYFSGQLEESKTAALQSVKLIATSSKKEKAGAAVIHNILGATFRKEQNYSKSVFHYEQAIQDFELFGKIDPRYDLDRVKAGPYHNLGNVLYEKGEYEKSLIYLKKALAIHQKIYPENNARIGMSHYSIGNVFYYQKAYHQAINQFDKAEEIFSLPPRNPLYMSALYQNKGQCYSTLLEYDRALVYLEKALHLRTETPGMDPALRAETLLAIGKIYKAKGDLKKAEKMHQQSIALYQSSMGEKNGEIANALHSLGLLLLADKRYEEALEQFHKSLLSNSTTMDLNFQLEELPPVNERSFMPRLYINAISRKGKAFYQQFLQSKDQTQLQTAYQHYVRCDEMIRTRRRQFDQAKDQIVFNEEFHEVYQEAVDVTYQMYKRDPQEKYMEQAVQFSEQSKTQALLAALTRSTVLHYPGVSEAILEREKNLSNQLNLLKETLAQSQVEDQDSSRQSKEEKLFELTTQYDQLLDSLKESSPTYYEWVYQNDKFNVQLLRKQLLKEGSQLVEYFISQHQIHLFFLSKDHFSWHTTPLPKDLKGEITAYLSAIHDQHILQFSGQPVPKSQQVKADQTYAQVGQSLYQLLIQPLPVPQKEEPSTLIIIPDGILGNLPFETLLTDMPAEIGSYHNYPYLINQYQISYAYSIDLLLQLQKKQRTTATHQKWLAFAPEFADCQQFAEKTSAQTLRSQSFGPLQNKAEVLSIQDIVGGKVLLEKEASLNNFIEQSPEYAFLHIASHGKANQQNPGQSMIGFSSRGNDKCLFDTLRASRIANLSLPAELVVLSACEGAVGELQDGEGVQSLAMAFTYAGVQSLCSTLWSVQDKAMREIMTSFYTHLDKGSTKDAALREAKLAYISSHDNSLSHPFYWAAPILIGDAKVVSFNHSSNLLYGLLFITLLISLLLFFLKSKKG